MIDRTEVLHILNPSIAYLIDTPKYRIISAGYNQDSNTLSVVYVLKGRYCTEEVVMTDELWDKYFDVLEIYLSDISQDIDYFNKDIINGIIIVTFRFIIKVNFL